MLSTGKGWLGKPWSGKYVAGRLLRHFSALIFPQKCGKNLWIIALQFSLNLDFSGLSSSLNHDRSTQSCRAARNVTGFILVYYSPNRRNNMDQNTMFLAAAIRAAIQCAAVEAQDSNVLMEQRTDFKTAFRTAYKDLQLAVDEIKDERPGSSRLWCHPGAAGCAHDAELGCVM